MMITIDHRKDVDGKAMALRGMQCAIRGMGCSML